MEIRPQLKTEQHLALTQEMRMSLSMLSLSVPDLAAFLQAEVESNPAADSDAFVESLQARDLLQNRLAPYLDSQSDAGTVSSSDSFDPFAGVAASETFRDRLHQEIRLQRPEEEVEEVAHWIIDSLDDSGYFIDPLAEERPDSFRKALALLRSVAPPGIGAGSLSESLILQLRSRGIKNAVLEELIEEDLPLLAARDFELIRQRYGIKDPEAVLELIQSLDPRPAVSLLKEEPAVLVMPDLSFLIQGEDIEVELNSALLPKISISSSYLALADSVGEEDRLVYRNYLARLTGIISAMEKRNDTLIRLGRAIAGRQKNYILERQTFLEPFSMSEAAEELKLHVSTISRAVKDKHVLAGRTVMPLSAFFSLSVKDTGVSRSRVQDSLALLVKNEDQASPLTDEVLRELLSQEGIAVSRRTVAKYREELNIPPRSRRRKKEKI